ncbi:MAG: AAA family ATPase [Deltaproteobacteria bacterium]|nr:AAA family ATPase [Deltaproteobacteria bacterium]
MNDIKGLPVGQAKFKSIRRKNFACAGETELLYPLVNSELPYFLSRPRLFGRSLLVSALQAFLKGGLELFRGLWIHDHSDYDWTHNPVIHLPVNGLDTENVGTVKNSLIALLRKAALQEKVTSEADSSIPAGRFTELTDKLSGKYVERLAAVLTGEYGAPILSSTTQPGLAAGIRKVLREFCGVLKPAEENRGFAFEESDSLSADRLPLAPAGTKSMGITDKESAEADLKNKFLDRYNCCTLYLGRKSPCPESLAGSQFF